MTTNFIAVIGTAGRDKTIAMNQSHWDFMYADLCERIQPNDTLISGGAAWADHLAVIAYLEDKVSNLILHLPAPFNGRMYEGEYGQLRKELALYIVQRLETLQETIVYAI